MLERAFDLCPKSLAIEVHRVGREVHEAPMFSTVNDDNDLRVTVPLGAGCAWKSGLAVMAASRTSSWLPKMVSGV